MPILVATGMKVSTVKHVHHTVEVDVPGKDSWRHAKAGAHEVMIALADGWVLHHPRRDSGRAALLDMVANMSPCDLILIEGFRDMAIPRVRLFELEANPRTVVVLDPKVVAVVGTKVPEGYAVPAFARDDALGVATFVLQYTKQHA